MISRAFDRTVDAMAAAAGLLLMFMMLAICYEVVLRYFLFRPPAWVTEISEYILLYATFLGAPWVLRRDAHVRVDIVLARLEPGLRRAMDIGTSAAGIGVCAVLFWYGTDTTLNLYQRGIPVIKSLSVPKFILTGIIPVGCFFLSVQFFRRILACRRQTAAKE